MRLRPAASFRLFAASALFGASSLVGAPARAQVPAGAPQASPASEPDARTHFDRALEQYRAGQYTRALSSLEQAARLDPNGKDLFFNLALVHEKLGQLPQAIAALERFRELETDEAERQRAALIIQRLRGAEGEVARPQLPQPCPPPAPARPVEPHGPSPVLVAAASVAAVSFVVGSVFGLKALSEDVSDESTSASLSVAQLRERGRRAERAALIADVSFAITAASAGTFVFLWLQAPSLPETRATGITVRGDF